MSLHLASYGGHGRPYSVLLPVGFTLPPPLPEARGALTAPFHPCPPRVSTRRAVCFLWHCPWGRPRRPLAGTVFPWSPDFPPSSRDNSGRPAVWRAGHGAGWTGASRRLPRRMRLRRMAARVVWNVSRRAELNPNAPPANEATSWCDPPGLMAQYAGVPIFTRHGAVIRS